MVTRKVSNTVILVDESILADCPIKGASIARGEGGLVITAPDEAAADAAEVWLAEIQPPGH